ncbi:hypothetical protein PHYBOEH_010190 [Phytophthora boehmeriae]|uniref:Uncharacterized protein n=1 Tax=Phytophthora boehmeriae TaxID=109152 RepID=A0A8T1WZI8_9STRA|nr:hypothetical protein PHYBOEH_010190 [Phytophthora boehmeriae]
MGAGGDAADGSVEKGTSSFSTVKCKLSRVCRLEPLCNEIQRSCLVLKQVQLEAYHVLNLHLLRCLRQEERHLPQFSQTFYYRCCAGVLEGDLLPKTTDCRDARLNATLVQYREMRRQIPGYQPPRLDYADPWLSASSSRLRCGFDIIFHSKKT